MRKILGALVVAVAVASTWAAISTPTRSSDDGGRSRLAAPAPAPAPAPARAPDPPATAQAASAPQKHAEAAPAPAKPPPAAEPEGDDADTVTEEGRPLNAKAVTLRRVFKGEQRDPEWADRTEKKLQAYTAKFQLGDFETESIVCAASICRLQFAFRGEQYDDRVYMMSRAIERMFSSKYALEPLGEVAGTNRIVVWTSRLSIDEQRLALGK